MGSLTQKAYLSSRTAQKSLSGVSVTITRGVTTSSVVTATLGTSRQEVVSGDGAQLYLRLRDYFIDVSDYTVSDVAVTPAKYDYITEVVNGTPTKFEVLSDGTDTPKSYQDGDRTVWRIHTKEKA